MSLTIILKKWAGADRDEAAKKMARVFRMDNERGFAVVRQLEIGQPWRFEHKIPEHQANLAVSHLQTLGFDVFLHAEKSHEQVEESACSQPAEDIPSETKKQMPFGFHGEGADLFRIVLVNQIKTILTLGIYHFWAKVKVRQFLWSHSSLMGDRFTYHGTGKELFRGFLRFAAMLVPFVIVTTYLAFQGEGGVALSDLLWTGAALMVPYFMVGAWRYRLSRTSWRGIRFSFRGIRWNAVKLYFIGAILTGLTLGLYWPIFKMQTETFWRRNCYFGNMQFDFDGEGRDIFKHFLMVYILSIVTLGLFLLFYGCWFEAYLKRYMWSRTHFAKGSFRFTATGGDLLMLRLVNLILLVCTLGIAYPWVVVRNRRFLTDHLFLEGDIDLDKAVQEMKDSGAIGEEALDAFDVPIDIG